MTDSERLASIESNPFFEENSERRKPPSAGTDTLEILLDEGPVTITWPDTLSTDSFAEFEYWINGVVQRARRRAGLPSGKKEKPKQD